MSTISGITQVGIGYTPSTTSKTSATSESQTPQDSCVVSLSETGTKLAAAASSTRYESLVQAGLSMNESDAGKLASDIAYSSDGILLDPATTVNGPWLKAGTKEVISDADRQYFNDIAGSVTAERIKIYEAEIAKGTSPAGIVKKLADFTMSQPERYLKLAGWT